MSEKQKKCTNGSDVLKPKFKKLYNRVDQLKNEVSYEVYLELLLGLI